MTNRLILAVGVSLALAGRGSAQSTIDLRTQARNVDFSQADHTKPSKVGTTLPPACSQGEMFFKTDVAAGTNLYLCTASNLWTQLVGTGGTSLPPMAGNAGKVLSTDGAAAAWQAMGGDVSGTAAAVTVGKIQGRAVAGTAPSDGEVLRWNAGAGQWQPGVISTGAPNYWLAFTGQTMVTIAGSAHGFGSANLLLDCYDSASPASRIEPDSVTIHPTSYDVVIRFSTAQSGRCVVNGSGGGGGGGGGGAVASVFGRAGAVAAQSGDYSFAQISGTLTDGQLGSGINAAKIGAGTVNNSKFGFLQNVTGDVQAQLNTKAAASHSHGLGGDVSGDAAATTVSRIQNRAISAAAPANGQALVWASTTSSWTPATISGGGGGSGPITASQIRDFDVVRTSATVLTIGETCSPISPCNVRFGNTVYSFTQSCTATLGAGTGTAYIYIANGGTLTVGHNLTATTSTGCLAQSGVLSFPADSVPISTWTAAGGTWNSSGGSDLRGWLSTKAISAGTGVTTAETGGRTIVGVNAATVPTYLSGSTTLNFPSIPTGTCSADQTFQVPGAAVNDAVAPGWPAALEAGLVGTMRVSAANTVAVRMCNLSGSALDPASGAFRATIVRSF